MRHARCGGPRTLFRTIDANLDCAFVEKALFVVVPNLGWASLPLPSDPTVQKQRRDSGDSDQ